MKMTNKTKRTIAGILFLLAAAAQLFGIVTVLTSMPVIDTQDFTTLITLIFLGLNALCTLVLILAGIRALKQKKLGKGMTYLTMFVCIFSAINAITTVMNGTTVLGNTMDVKQFIHPALALVAWYFLIFSGGTALQREGQKGEADRIAEQAEKQTSIYDQQLKAGILTKEEYNQIMKNQK